jgi:hypothetical protein
VRNRRLRAILAVDGERTEEGHVTVALRLQVKRGEDNRLSGTVSTSDDGDVRAFSGTLELMRVFEELVPVERDGAPADPSGLAT